MSRPSPDEIREALARWEGWEFGDPFDQSTLPYVVEAARLYADLLETGREVTITADHKFEPAVAVSLWPGRYRVVRLDTE